jgi:hypothetical protein
MDFAFWVALAAGLAHEPDQRRNRIVRGIGRIDGGSLRKAPISLAPRCRKPQTAIFVLDQGQRLQPVDIPFGEMRRLAYAKGDAPQGGFSLGLSGARFPQSSRSSFSVTRIPTSSANDKISDNVRFKRPANIFGGIAASVLNLFALPR